MPFRVETHDVVDTDDAVEVRVVENLNALQTHQSPARLAACGSAYSDHIQVVRLVVAFKGHYIFGLLGLIFLVVVLQGLLLDLVEGVVNFLVVFR